MSYIERSSPELSPYSEMWGNLLSKASRGGLSLREKRALVLREISLQMATAVDLLTEDRSVFGDLLSQSEQVARYSEGTLRACALGVVPEMHGNYPEYYYRDPVIMSEYAASLVLAVHGRLGPTSADMERIITQNAGLHGQDSLIPGINTEDMPKEGLDLMLLRIVGTRIDRFLCPEVGVLAEEAFTEYEQEVLHAPTPEEIREKLRNPQYLPSYEELLDAFPIIKSGVDWNWRGFINDATDKHGFYECLTQEYVAWLGRYLRGRAKTNSGTTRILEVGAGDGKLGHFIREQLTGEDVEYIITDSKKLDIPQAFPEDSIETLSHEEALAKYSPHIVICSWMPYREDWTREFRSHPNLKEYILIGEADYGSCGDQSLTWNAFHYEKDGFRRYNLNNIMKEMPPQLDRFDSSPLDPTHSWTVSFRREANSSSE